MKQVDKSISVTGCCCPMPLIQVAQATQSMEPGQVLCVEGDDPIFEAGIRDYCEAKGHEVLDVRQAERLVTVLLRV